MNHSPTIHPNARVIRVCFAGHAELAEQIERDKLKLLEVRSGRQAVCVESEHRVARNLPRHMQHHTTAAAHPSHWPTASVQVFWARANVRTASLAADGDARGVVAQDQGSRGSVTADVVYQSALKGEQSVEREGAEQIRG